MFDQLTDTELNELELSAYRATMRLYDEAQKIYGQLVQMPPSAPGYAPLLGQGTALMRAAREQDAIHGQVRDLNRSRVLAAAWAAMAVPA